MTVVLTFFNYIHNFFKILHMCLSTILKKSKSFILSYL